MGPAFRSFCHLVLRRISNRTIFSAIVIIAIITIVHNVILHWSTLYRGRLSFHITGIPLNFSSYGTDLQLMFMLAENLDITQFSLLFIIFL